MKETAKHNGATGQRAAAAPANGGTSADDTEVNNDALKAQLFDLARRFKRFRPVPPALVKSISPLEMHALLEVTRADRQGRVLRPSDLAHRLHSSPSSVSQLLRALEDRGLVQRCRAEGDSRTVQVKLTEAGQRISQEARCDRDQFFDGLIDSIGQEEMNQFLETLRKVCEYTEQSGEFEDDPFVPDMGGDGPCA